MNDKENKVKLNKYGRIAFTGPFRWLIIQGILFFVSAGHFNIPRAWIFFSIAFTMALINSIILYRHAPDLLNQRGELKKDVKTWDKVLLLIYFSVLLLIIPVIAGLDVGRFTWSGLGIPFMVLGIALYLFSNLFILWSMLTNRHFEAMVRIQKDRDHKVISTGPYRIVRHPGYVGMALTSIIIPLIIGSLYALIPGGICFVVVIIRTNLEDKTLQNELEGYAEFTKKTRYRLLPGIW